MAGRVTLARMSADPISMSAHLAAVEHARSGAAVSFTGMIRNHDGGRAVLALDYEAHETASAVLLEIAREIAARDGVVAVAVSHRTGSLQVGDVALAAAVSAEHRAEAFAACGDLVEEVKARVPIWKRQEFADGTDEWVGSA